LAEQPDPALWELLHRMADDIAETKEDGKATHKLVAGNGTRGLCATVELIWQRQVIVIKVVTALVAANAVLGVVVLSLVLYHYLTGEMTHMWPTLMGKLLGMW
jgi:hypothetical protein